MITYTMKIRIILGFFYFILFFFMTLSEGYYTKLNVYEINWQYI
jgi:hypothetical protein